MKNISYNNFVKLLTELENFISNKPNPCEYLLGELNKQGAWERKKKLMRLSAVKYLWNSTEYRKVLLTLLVLKHYQGNFISMSEGKSMYIMEDEVKRLSIKLDNLYKESRKSFAE